MNAPREVAEAWPEADDLWARLGLVLLIVGSFIGKMLAITLSFVLLVPGLILLIVRPILYVRRGHDPPGIPENRRLD